MRNDRQDPLPMPDAVLAAKYREAAEAALRNPFETPDQCRTRAAYYEAQDTPDAFGQFCPMCGVDLDEYDGEDDAQ